MSRREKIILDVDTGHDDAIAILVAAKSDKIDLRGITVVAGNQTLPKTLKNTLDICDFANIDVPVYAGMHKPLVKNQLEVSEVHGDSGLGDIPFPDTTKEAEPKHAVDFIIEEALKSNGELILVPTGTLTNIAMALNLKPEIKEKIKKIVLMGGACGTGNATPSAEFNIYTDPEAAEVVFNSNVPIVMTGLDLTSQALADDKVINRIKNLNNRVANLTLKLLELYGETYREFYGFEHPPVHDPCTVAKIIDDNVFTTKKMRVDIETKSELTRGRTVCDVHNRTGREPNAEVAIDLDKDRFWDIVINNLGKY